MNKKPIIRVILVVLVAALIAAGLWRFYPGLNRPNENQLVLYGNIDIREADLAFNNSEHIDRVLVQEGDRVSKGQLLATLHRERFGAETAYAEAHMMAQKAVVARLEAGTRVEEVRQARANLDAANAKLVDAEVTFERTENLYKKRGVSKQVLDDTEAILNTARAEFRVANEGLALAVAGPREEYIEEARATLKSAEARLMLAQEVQKDAELYAPADGIIRDRILEPGDMASPQTPVFSLASTNPVWVRAYVPETALGKLAPGMSADVSTDSYPGKVYPGWIGFISPTAEFTPKNVETPELRTRLVYQVRIYACNPQEELRLGMPATVAISLTQRKPAVGHVAPDCAQPKAD